MYDTRTVPKNLSNIKHVDGIEVVNNFVYLGSIIENIEGRTLELRYRVQVVKSVTERLTKIWRDQIVNKKVKIRHQFINIFNILKT